MSIRTLIKSLNCYKRLPNIKELLNWGIWYCVNKARYWVKVLWICFILIIYLFFKWNKNSKNRTFYYILLSLQTCYVCMYSYKKKSWRVFSRNDVIHVIFWRNTLFSWTFLHFNLCYVFGKHRLSFRRSIFLCVCVFACHKHTSWHFKSSG